MKRIFIFWVVFFLLLASSINSIWAFEEPYISLGSATLRLGMSKTQVLRYLGKQGLQTHTTHPIGDEFGQESYSVWSKYLPQEALGQIIFKADKLVFISKHWGFFHDKNAFSFVKTLFSVLRNAMKKEDSIAVISTSIYSQPTYESKTIELRIGAYEVNFFCVEYQDPLYPNVVSISQILKDYQNWP
ncbi:MAG: hypothetical protein JRJ29_15035 [Deltaproteobacteria bacterium]|nr:hypothetical protein [Deltaproteobacteria bacterium]